MKLPIQQNNLIALFLTMCLIQSTLASPLTPSMRKDLLNILRSRERRYAKQIDEATAIEAEDILTGKYICRFYIHEASTNKAGVAAILLVRYVTKNVKDTNRVLEHPVYERNHQIFP